jgi:hypothetical protein
MRDESSRGADADPIACRFEPERQDFEEFRLKILFQNALAFSGHFCFP